jgi:hypothetical protein
MIVAIWKLRELPTDLFRRHPDGLLAVPAAGHHVFGKTNRCWLANRECWSPSRSQQDGADHLGATCKAGKLHSSGRSQGVSLADLRSSPVQSVEGGYGATVGETGPEEPDVLIVPGARIYHLVPVSELLDGPAAPSLHQRPDRWQHPTSANLLQKTACTWGGGHR